MDNKWDALISSFRSLGGIANNICQRNGCYGRGVFPVDRLSQSKIFTPSNVMIKSEDLYLKNNQVRIKPDKLYSHNLRRFFNFYQDNFSWGCGGRENTEIFEKGLNEFPENLKKLIKQSFNEDLKKRHEGDWDLMILRRFISERQFNFDNNNFILPIAELVNHEVKSPRRIDTFDGVTLIKHNLSLSEFTYSYGYKSSIMRVLNYGFFCKESMIFSVPFVTYIEGLDIQFICKGLEVTDDNIDSKRIGNQIIINGLPIFSHNSSSQPKEYLKEFFGRNNIISDSNVIFSKIIKYNIDIREHILEEIESVRNYSSQQIKAALTFESKSIQEHD